MEHYLFVWLVQMNFRLSAANRKNKRKIWFRNLFSFISLFFLFSFSFFLFFFFFLSLFFFFFLTIYQWPNRGLDNILIIYGVANEIVSFNIKCSKKFVIDFDLGKYLI